jgi:hypothetical protein
LSPFELAEFAFPSTQGRHTKTRRRESEEEAELSASLRGRQRARAAARAPHDEVELELDGDRVGFCRVGNERRWGAAVRLDDISVSLSARNVLPADIKLTRAGDLDPYLRS